MPSERAASTISAATGPSGAVLSRPTRPNTVGASAEHQARNRIGQRADVAGTYGGGQLMPRLDQARTRRAVRAPDGGRLGLARADGDGLKRTLGALERVGAAERCEPCPQHQRPEVV